MYLSFISTNSRKAALLGRIRPPPRCSLGASGVSLKKAEIKTKSKTQNYLTQTDCTEILTYQGFNKPTLLTVDAIKRGKTRKSETLILESVKKHRRRFSVKIAKKIYLIF